MLMGGVPESTSDLVVLTLEDRLTNAYAHYVGRKVKRQGTWVTTNAELELKVKK